MDSQMHKDDDEYTFNLDNDLDMEDDNVFNFEDLETDEDDESDVNDVKDTNRFEVRDALKRICDLSGDDVWSMEFVSEAEACEFYSTYAKCHGFVMRKDDIDRDVKGNRVMRQMVCNKAGKRSDKHLNRVDQCREHRQNTRTNCRARIRVKLDHKTSKWKVVAFEEGHNHDLTPPQYANLFPAYHGLTDADKAQVDEHKFSVRTSHIMGYIVGQKDGFADLGFTKKDLYNHIDQQRRTKVRDGDANAGISYLRGKAGNDPLFFGLYTLTDDDRLKDLFWADGCSIIDYECFGDVLVFETTYKKNRYNKPLVILSGSNHHGQTIIFGCALISDMTTDTYKWLLETFLEAMGNKQPKAVVTVDDGAMREAIKQVCPNATHRLCARHLQKNACKNVKDPGFLEEFSRIIYSNVSVEEFEHCWNGMVLKHGLSNNEWVVKTYENKTMWAHAYLRDKFFGHIRTSQCEGINSLIKSCIRKKNSLIEFMQKFDLALREYRNNELISDFMSFNSEGVMTTPLWKIEACAAKIFTRHIFMKVKAEIEEAGAFNVVHRSENGDNVLFKMDKYCSAGNEWGVVLDKVNCKFVCDCRLFESRGIPCCHIFCALRNENIDSFPSSLILKRWTKATKSEFICSTPIEEIDVGKMARLRFGSLAADCNRLCHLASKDIDVFVEIKDEILKLIDKVQLLSERQGRFNSFKKAVGDPMLVKTRGAPLKQRYRKKRRRCSNCNNTGHYYKKCPKFADVDNDHVSNDVNLLPSKPNASSQEINQLPLEPDASSKEINIQMNKKATDTEEAPIRHTSPTMAPRPTKKKKPQSKVIVESSNQTKVTRLDHGVPNGEMDNAGHSKSDIDRARNPIPIAPRIGLGPFMGYWPMREPYTMLPPYSFYPPVPHPTYPQVNGALMYPPIHQNINICGGVGTFHNGIATIGNTSKGATGSGGSTAKK